jgi:2-(1,2-epoxy-1,2-dihydrophenyl)acetyl-CoA isomerase
VVRVAATRWAGCLEVVLARPEHGNAIDMSFATVLLDAARQVRSAVLDGQVACVLLRAEGRHFCVGGDLKSFPSDADEATPHLAAMAAVVHEALAILCETDVPTVARVHGVAAGAGIGLACFADVVVASTVARFVPAYAAVGLSPDCGTTWLLPRLVGPRRAADMVLTNRSVDAATAERWGLVSRLVDAERLDEEVDEVVTAVLNAGTDASVASKRLLRSAPGNGLRAHLADEAQTIAALGGTTRALSARAALLDDLRNAGRPTTTGSEIP